MTITTLYKWLRRVIRVILLITIVVILQYSSKKFFSKPPPVTARWEISSNNSYHLGEVIKATLYVTTQPGVTVDIKKLPDIGDVLSLPARIDDSEGRGHYYDVPQMISEGELEVVSRQIRTHFKEDHLVTEIEYGLMYLLPIDLTSPADDKRLPYYVPVNQEYPQVTESGRVEPVSSGIFVDMTSFFIIPRIDENSQPFIEFFRLTPPHQAGPYVRLAGFVSLGLAFCLIIRRALTLTPKRPSSQTLITDRPPAARELFETWCERPETLAFIEAVKLYRRGVWGQPRFSLEASKLWAITTFVLYSGVELNHDQMESIFARLVEVLDDSA